MASFFRNSKAGARKVLSALRKHQEVLIFDNETTGLTENDKIIQFACVRYSVDPDTLEMKELDWIDTYINPEIEIPEKIVEITGISNKLVANYGNESVMGPQIVSYLMQQKLVAAYNTPFDEKMVKAMANRVGVACKLPESLDVLIMARDLISKEQSASHKLGDITKYLYPDDKTQFHSAIEDVRATGKVMQKLILMYDEILKAPEPENGLMKLHMEWAAFSSNPRRPSELRIKVNIDKDQEHYGDIFWDVADHCWSCKKTSQAEKLFKSSDIEDLERQVLTVYGPKYEATTMEDLAKNWGAAKRAEKGA